ncbi:hypothetical protein CVT25_004589 [Psilocybe cyanescens]|uniref:Uncharacterized protein n=1 Tax=Psilocybe cyanescens TaxID=93625 RepID=A0A409W7M1_PSICY|nr:hypothetical protein CVT25_004589 [Psilocybe cyanescens]
MAVFDTCSVPMRTSRIEFEPEVEALASIKTPLADDLDTPQIPFLDVFNVGGINHNDDSDDYSDSDLDTDAFVFDNLPHRRPSTNGARYNYH